MVRDESDRAEHHARTTRSRDSGDHFPHVGPEPGLFSAAGTLPCDTPAVDSGGICDRLSRLVDLLCVVVAFVDVVGWHAVGGEEHFGAVHTDFATPRQLLAHAFGEETNQARVLVPVVDHLQLQRPVTGGVWRACGMVRPADVVADARNRRMRSEDDPYRAPRADSCKLGHGVFDTRRGELRARRHHVPSRAEHLERSGDAGYLRRCYLRQGGDTSDGEVAALEVGEKLGGGRVAPPDLGVEGG